MKALAGKPERLAGPTAKAGKQSKEGKPDTSETPATACRVASGFTCREEHEQKQGHWQHL